MTDHKESHPKQFYLLVLFASFSSLVYECLTNLTKIVKAIGPHFYIAATALWVIIVCFASVTPLGPVPLRRKRKWLLILAATVLFLGALGYQLAQYYEHNLRVTQPAQLPQAALPSIRILSVEAAETILRLDSFSINEDLSSFYLNSDHLFGDGPVVPSYDVDRNIPAAFHQGACIGVYGDKPARAAVPVLERFWASNNRKDLAAYLDEPNSLGRLIRERGDIFAQIIPTPQQLSSMSSDDYKIVQAWVHDCVGMYQPVFKFVISNNGTKDVILNQLVYHVLKTGVVKGGVAGPIYPLATFDHKLVWAPGDQVQSLALLIPAHDHVAFNVRLYPDSSQHGITWWMNIEARDSQGDAVKTNNFQLTMNKAK